MPRPEYCLGHGRATTEGNTMARVTGLGHVGIYVRDPDDAVLAEVDRLWNEVRHVPVGGTMTDEPAMLQIAR